MTYLEALSELQQRGFDALKVAQATQLSALKTTRECAAAFTITDLTSALAAFGFALLEQQVDYAQKLTSTLTATSDDNRAERTPTESAHPAPMSEPALSSAPAEPVAPLFGQVDSVAAAAVEVFGAPVTIDDPDAAPTGESRHVGAEVRLDAAIRAADHDEALSKVLPAPVPSQVAPGPRLPASNPTAKRSKIASVSGDVPPAKRRSTSK